MDVNLILRSKYRARWLENVFLRSFGCKRENVIETWGRFDNEELLGAYSLLSIKMIRE
jgi:hypothetical protein